MNGKPLSRRERKLQRLKENERKARGLPELKIPIKGKLKQKLSRERGERRQSQFSDPITMHCPGVKFRGKMGPSGERKYKTWLKEQAPDFVPLSSFEHIGAGRVG